MLQPSVIVVFIFDVSLLLLQTVCLCCINVLCYSPIATHRMSMFYLFSMLVLYCDKPYVIVVFIFYVSLILLQTYVIVVFILYVSLILLQTICLCCIDFYVSLIILQTICQCCIYVLC